MIYDKFELSDGRIVTFSDLKEAELPELLSVFNSVVQEGVYFLRSEGQLNVDEARKWLREHLKAGMMYVVAKVDGKIVGGATMEPREGKASHVAYFGIFFQKEFRNLGIGTRLARRMIELALQKKFGIIQLYVFASNRWAIHVYKKLGFENTGRIKNGVRLPDGIYTDEIIMALHLK